MSHLFVSILFSLLVGTYAGFTANPPYYARHYTSIQGARGMVMDIVGDILVVSDGPNTITAVWESTDGVVNKTIIVNGGSTAPGLNHGIALNGGYLYASNPGTVYRWSYVSGQRTIILTPPQIVISGIPTSGHWTRTIIFDSQNRLYVSVGSGSNVDQNSELARVRRFSLDNIPVGGIPFEQGEVFADGLRNEVGLAFDARGVLWGVENGVDDLHREDLGGDIHETNPAEEMHKFDQAPGTHYGYPYCWTTFNLPGYSRGMQFAWPGFMNDGIHTDAWCRNAANNQLPALAMAAHNAPLGITFYDGLWCTGDGAFPCSWIGDAIVPFHGSWNTDSKVGYRVSWFKFNTTTDLPIGQDVNFLYEDDLDNRAPCFRPVNAIFNQNGHLIVSSDDTNELVKVTYGSPPKRILQV